ncbi:unnamed protein product [Strongylus vulgaris]|uniref:Uncharacterized protein n=1 Tax=Strongylus vulgaris TaxID=40348 RepID=A0A3P7LCF0_STRVU|nr:unnamed protein product [Strongylus vulgaris]
MMLPLTSSFYDLPKRDEGMAEHKSDTLTNCSDVLDVLILLPLTLATPPAVKYDALAV